MSGATPRITRSRTNTPLPALQTRQSHAYGAQGKAALAQQVSTSTAELNAAFSTTARPRGSTRPPSRSITPAPAKKQKPKATTPIIEEDDDEGNDDEPVEEDDDEMSRPGTAIQHSAAYINLPAVPPTRPQRPGRPQMPNGFTGDDEDFEPGRTSILFRTIPRFFERLYGDGWQFLVMCLLTFALLMVALSNLGWYVGAGIGATRDYQLSRALQYNFNAFQTGHLFSDEIQKLNTSDMQWAINAHLLGRVEKLETNSTALQNDLAVYQAMIDELQSIIPNTIVMAEDNGQFTIPPLFWKALTQKMESPDASPVWQHFIETNAEQLQTMSQEVFDGNFQSGRVLSQDAFNVALSEHSRVVHDDLEQLMRTHKMSVLEEARAAAVNVLEKSEIMSLARLQINKLGFANYAYNMDRKLRNINYFGIGLGAMIDPHYTSETKMPPTRTWPQWLLHHIGLARQYPHPPTMALTSWTEPTDAWCAAPSADGDFMAQLTVKTAHKIALTSVTIEHYPASGTRDNAAAPKDFETWAQVSNATEAKQIQEAREEMRGGHACEGKAPNGEKNWVCVGRDKYDVNEHNFVQTFHLFPDMQSIGASTDRVALRVLSNWGAPGHTCLYRVSAHGVEI